MTAEFQIFDGDDWFAEVSGEDRERIWGEAMHYAMQCDAPRIEEIVRTPAPMGEVPPGVFPESEIGTVVQPLNCHTTEEYARIHGAMAVATRESAVGLLPGPELGPHDKLPCAVACEGGPTFHQGVQLRALLGYLARRVTYNNQPPPTPEAKAQFKALLNEARGNSVVAVGQDDGVSAIPPGPIRDLGARLASMLDEDRWASIEPYLLACLSQVRVEEPKT